MKFVARQKPLSGEVRLIRRFDASFDKLWARLAPRFDVAVRRDAAYLQWKFVSPPHVRYAIHSSSENVNFSTSKKFNSTGVERPKIVTITLSTPLSGLISSTWPVNPLKGPDNIRTCSLC